MNIAFILNGEDINVSVDPDLRLSALLHDTLKLTSVRSSCGLGTCGSCLVIMDSRLLPSCLVPAFNVRGREVITFEGLAQTDEFSDVERGFEKAHVETCGFCYPGKVMAAHYLAERLEENDPELIRQGLDGIRCRCTDFHALVKGVGYAVEFRKERSYAGEP